MARKVSTGLEEVEPPSKASSKPPAYSSERLKAIADQLSSARWLTDGEVYHSRSAAYHHVTVLVRALSLYQWDLCRDNSAIKAKTWGSGAEYRWAIRKE